MRYVKPFIGLTWINVLLTTIAIAQKNDYPKPKVEVLKYNKWDKKYGIRYYLPTYPAKLLDSIFLQNMPKFNEEYQFIRLEVNGDTISLYGFSTNVKLSRFKKDDPIRLLQKTTHRYILINDKRVLFYFDTDTMFGFPSFSLSGYKFYIKFVGRKNEDGKVIEWDY